MTVDDVINFVGKNGFRNCSDWMYVVYRVCESNCIETNPQDTINMICHFYPDYKRPVVELLMKNKSTWPSVEANYHLFEKQYELGMEFDRRVLFDVIPIDSSFNAWYNQIALNLTLPQKEELYPTAIRYYYKTLLNVPDKINDELYTAIDEIATEYYKLEEMDEFERTIFVYKQLLPVFNKIIEFQKTT